MFRLLLTAVFQKHAKGSVYQRLYVNCARGMAQLESNCALSSNIEKEIRRNAYLPVIFVIGVYFNMYYVYHARYITKVDDANRNIFEQARS